MPLLILFLVSLFYYGYGRAARPGIRPPSILPIPKEIVDQANIEVGETFAIYVDEDKSIRLVRPKI